MKKGGSHLLSKRQIRFDFIEKNRSNYSVEKMCKCMQVSTNAYYTWLRNQAIEKPKKNTLLFLKKRIKYIFEASKSVYGSARVEKQLEREQLFYSRSYIAYLMRQMGLRSVLSRKFKVCTTDSNHANPIAKNKLNREFQSDKLGQKWVSDITYIMVLGKWNYLTTIIDLADRKVLAYTLSQDMSTENTVYKVWKLARKVRNITNDHIFHSDRGVQYTSCKMTTLFEKSTKMTQSMSRKGNCWDNAVAESFFKSIKYECTNRYKFKSIIHPELVISDYMKWYNNTRLHSSLGYKTPIEKEIEIRIKNYIKVA